MRVFVTLVTIAAPNAYDLRKTMMICDAVDLLLFLGWLYGS